MVTGTATIVEASRNRNDVEVNEHRIYDCTTFAGRHETAEVEFDAEQTHVTIYDDQHGVVNMWNDDSTDPADVVNGLESLYLRISRIWG